jgi:alpha-L-fucosidase
VLEASFPKPITFDHALIMERLNDGQHVEHYRVEAWDGAHWKAVFEGHAIGHKRIDSFAPVTASRIRLNILSSSAAAEIREFQVFNIESALGSSTLER